MVMARLTLLLRQNSTVVYVDHQIPGINSEVLLLPVLLNFQSDLTVGSTIIEWQVNEAPLCEL